MTTYLNLKTGRYVQIDDDRLAKHGQLEQAYKIKGKQLTECQQQLAEALARIAELVPQCDAAYAPYREMVQEARAEVDKFSTALYTMEKERDDFKAAALLGDDPDGVTPEMVEKHITGLRIALAERDRRIVQLKAIIAQGWELSAYTAAINWDNRPNTQEWLDGLSERIESFQQIALLSPAPAADEHRNEEE